MPANEKQTHKKILLVGPYPPPIGGISIYVKNLLDAKIDGIEFHLYNTAVPSWVEPFSKEGARTYASVFEISVWSFIKKIIYIFGGLFTYLWKLITIRPAIVQVFTCSYWGYWRNWLYILIARVFWRKTVFHLLNAIDQFYSEVGNFQKFILRQSMNSADCYLLQSLGLEAWVKQYSHKKVIGIWNGIDLTQIPPKVNNTPELIDSIGCPIGITIGNLSVNKGTREMLEAMKLLADQNIDLFWVFVGRGDIQFYSDLSNQLGLANRVCFTGRIDNNEKWQLLQHADIFSLPSYAEGQPLSIIEAMACGLPVVSTKVGSIPEMIEDGVTGRLIDPVDILSLAKSIQFLLNNPLIMKNMGNSSRKLCQERHDIKSMYAALRAIYLSL